MKPFLKGAFVEYKVENGRRRLLSEVIFQFNPEKIQKTYQISQRPTGKDTTDSTHAGEEPVEKLALTIYFNASDLTNQKNPLSLLHGISPQLSLLEKYARPLPAVSAAGAAFQDTVGEKAQKGVAGKSPPAEVQRQEYPRVLFVWGENRILPVVFESLSINELQFDSRLNPTQAEASVGLAVILNPNAEDSVAKGALKFTAMKNQIKMDLYQKSAEGMSQVVDLFKLD